LISRRNFSPEEKSDINEVIKSNILKLKNFRKFSDEIYQLRDRVEKISGGVSVSSAQAGQALVVGDDLLIDFYKELDSLSGQLAQSQSTVYHNMIYL
jgi:hypothetical protein